MRRGLGRSVGVARRPVTGYLLERVGDIHFISSSGTAILMDSGPTVIVRVLPLRKSLSDRVKVHLAVKTIRLYSIGQ